MIDAEDEFYSVLESIITLLVKYKINDWTQKLESKLFDFRISDDNDKRFDILQSIRNYYGGMGSLNDIYLSDPNLSTNDLDNDMFKTLKTKLFELTDVLQKQLK